MIARSKTAVRAGIRTEPLLLRRNHRNSGRVLVSYRAVLHGRAFRPYQGPHVAAASPIRVKIVRKPEGQVGFAVHARRWVVERFFAWINRNRRLAKDVEATIASAEAFLYAASTILLLQRSGR